MKMRVGGQDGLRRGHKVGSAGQVGDDRSGLLCNQGTGSYIPGFQSQFPKTIKPAAGYVAQVQSG